MAIKLEDKVNVTAPDTDFPYGDIKDDDGTGDGTPVDRKTYGDFHQFFARILDKSGIIANGLPDNAYSGFQYFEAFDYFAKKFRTVIDIHGIISLNDTYFNKLIIAKSAIAPPNVNSISLPASSSDNNSRSITIYATVQFDVTPSGSDTINGNTGTLTLNPGDCLDITLNGSDYIVTNNAISAVNPLSAHVSGGGQTGTGSLITIKFPTVDNDEDGIYNASTGKITLPKSGYYELNTNIYFKTNTVIGTGAGINFLLFKNGVQYNLLDNNIEYAGNGAYVSLYGSFILKLDAADYLELKTDTVISVSGLWNGNLTCKFINK